MNACSLPPHIKQHWDEVFTRLGATPPLLLVGARKRQLLFTVNVLTIGLEQMHLMAKLLGVNMLHRRSKQAELAVLKYVVVLHIHSN